MPINIRAEVDWIAAVPRICTEVALIDLDKAYSNFFAGRAEKPTPRRRGVNESFTFNGPDIPTRRINKRWSEARLPKIGWVRFRDTRPRWGSPKDVIVRLDAPGWHISFACAIEHEAATNNLPTVGIDRGVANAVALSTGELLAMPASLERLDKQRRRAQRALSRRKRGSRRYARARKRAAALAARAARIRKDFNHRASADITRRFGTVAIEALNTGKMTRSARGTVEKPGKNVAQKAGLNRSILSQGWYQLESFLAYKLEASGGTLVKVNPAYTSQTCSACGSVNAKSRESQARFVCVECGHAAHADVNAAINIKRRASGPLLHVEDGREAA